MPKARYSPASWPPAFPWLDGILGAAIPGVIQNSAGIGKEVAQGGIFTAVGILSAALAFVGLALSPGLLYLAQTTAPAGPRGSGPSGSPRAWAVAALLVLVPFLAARPALGPDLAVVEPVAAIGLTLILVTAGQLAVAFFTTSGTLSSPGN